MWFPIWQGGAWQALAGLRWLLCLPAAAAGWALSGLQGGLWPKALAFGLLVGAFWLW
jgi:hypothetical protein